MSAEKIISSWKKKEFKQIHLLHGEEDYFIDQAMNYAEHHILSESEASFNLTIFYGKDANWVDIVNACKRYPMFAEKQVVLLKEAQMMNSFDMLESYINNPLSTTIFIISHKGKLLDKRTKAFKSIQKFGEVLESNKIPEWEIQKWIATVVKSKGFSISPKSVSLLNDHIGNNLSRLLTEIEKLSINLGEKKNIDDDDIEKYIGISKEHNIFELQDAIVNKDLSKAIKIVNYFEHNPKAAPIQQALPAMYSFFSRVYSAYGLANTSESALRPLFYNNTSALNQATAYMKNYGYAGVERHILLLHHYNMKSVGVGDSGTESTSLLKEMVAKMVLGN